MLSIRSVFPRLALSSFTILCLAAPAFAGGPSVVKASRHDTSAPLAVLAAGGNLRNPGPDQQADEPRPTGPALTSSKSDSVASPLTTPLTGVTQVLGFDGQSADDNRAVFGFAFVPPDTNGAVGASQYVQMVNVTIAVYSKKDGSVQLPPTPFMLSGRASADCARTAVTPSITPTGATPLSSTTASPTAGS